MEVPLHPELPVLLVDDEPMVLSAETKVLNAAGISNLLVCQDPREVMPLLASREVDVVLLDIAMPYLSGEALLSQIQQSHPQIPVIIVTASEDIDVAVRCMKKGAFDYMVKAVEPSRLISGVRRAVELRQLGRRYAMLRRSFLADKLTRPEAFRNIVTRSRRMQAIFVFAESIAPTAETILLTGETGCGKELLAEALHAASGRKGPLVKVNAAGLDDAMFADALFGHLRGSFTGAEAARQGLIQQAAGGTLLLDEIGDLSPASQVKLLRLLEAHEYYPIGSDLLRSTDARFLLATNRNLRQLAEEGLFRKDLYFRLQTHEIRIPALRERKEDLPLLLDRFLEEASSTLGKKHLAVPPELLTLLDTYDYPGNVRELRSIVFRAVGRQKAKMLPIGPFREAMGFADEPAPASPASAAWSLPERLPSLKEATERLIAEALSRARGNQAIAAGLLGISPQALSKRLARRHRAPTG